MKYPYIAINGKDIVNEPAKIINILQQKFPNIELNQHQVLITIMPNGGKLTLKHDLGI